MKKIWSFFLLCFLIMNSAVFAQGLNNSYAIDSTDIKNCLKLMGVEIFKFPVQSPTAGKEYYLNFVLEEYEKGELKRTNNFFEGIEKNVPPGYSLDVFVKSVTNVAQFLRVYSYDRSSTDYTLQVQFDDMSQSYGLNTDTAKYGLSGTRAMNYAGAKVGEKVPVFVRYMSDKGKQFIHCPGSTPVANIVKMYGYVAVLYVELKEKQSSVSSHK